MSPGTATACVETTEPSIENVTEDAPQSIRYRWADPSQDPGIATSVDVPLFVRANSVSDVPFVLNMAHRATLFRSTPKPACWYGAPPNVATNSMDRPAEKLVSVAS